MSIFRQKVHNIVRKIPIGRVATYAQIARASGYPRSARAVGTVLSKNNSPETPCHRVVRADGFLGKYNGLRGVSKADLLKKEGMVILTGRVDLDIYSVNLSSSHPE